ncbi:hypothetical protein [Klebsiella phage vB_KpnS-VAC51]|uniref:Tail protein n=4 Tax=Sugarlandvirus TaxID=2560233 RepID=A0A9E7NEK2_9CAUD|nr:hypothetical protein [Klebsiella phage vB_KpnS-VAC35]UEP19508.1 hypothetical protein [Klebsiella phage vB_KpnS-VAC51]UTN90237.1 putative tail protein [Klebsiella phage vB_KpnS_Uniso31]WJE88482.1 hypothetical protein [Klebsiella phage Kpn02]
MSSLLFGIYKIILKIFLDMTIILTLRGENKT